MATKSFRIFATKEDLFSIFFDFQQNVKIHYFKCGRMYDLVEISDITKDTLFGINQKGNLLNSQYMCEQRGIRLIKLPMKGTELDYADSLKRAFQNVHIFISSDTEEDVEIVKNTFERWRDSQ